MGRGFGHREPGSLRSSTKNELFPLSLYSSGVRLLNFNSAKAKNEAVEVKPKCGNWQSRRPSVMVEQTSPRYRPLIILSDKAILCTITSVHIITITIFIIKVRMLIHLCPRKILLFHQAGRSIGSRMDRNTIFTPPRTPANGSIPRYLRPHSRPTCLCRAGRQVPGGRWAWDSS